MSVSNSSLRSKIGKAKGLGAAHHGVSHWWWQRLTAVALVPLSLWFFYSLLTAMLSADAFKVAEWMADPLSALVMVLLLIAMFAHAKLGLQVVVEDYVKAPFMKYALLLFITFACVALPAVGIIAVLKLHFLDFAASL